MTTALHRMLPVGQLSSGRRLWIYRHVRPVAERLFQPRLVAHIDMAMEHDVHTRSLDNRWSWRGRTIYADGVPDIDGKVDGVLTSIRDVGDAHARGMAEGDEMAATAEHLLATIFPNGLTAVIKLPYVDQVAAVEIILAKLQNELAPAVRMLGLERKVARLASLTAVYRQAIDQGPSELEFATVRAARELGHTYLLEMIAMVLGTYHDSRDPRHVLAREELLSPVFEQMALAREANIRARRRSRTDAEPAEPELDPDAGDPDEAPADLTGIAV